MQIYLNIISKIDLTGTTIYRHDKKHAINATSASITYMTQRTTNVDALAGIWATYNEFKF